MVGKKQGAVRCAGSGGVNGLGGGQWCKAVCGGDWTAPAASYVFAGSQPLPESPGGDGGRDWTMPVRLIPALALLLRYFDRQEALLRQLHLLEPDRRCHSRVLTQSVPG